jgi:hypothetical protein
VTAHDADMATTIVPYVEAPMRSLWRYRPELSRPGPTRGAQYWSSTSIQARGSASSRRARRTRAISRRRRPPHLLVFQLERGEGPAFAVAAPLDVDNFGPDADVHLPDAGA